MTTAKIGLKLANGEFYPVLQDGVPARKRLVVTTVKDGQKSVQIDLYRGHGPRVEDAAYIGSLVVENIREAPGGEPDIRLELGLRADGLLSASAEDPSSGSRQSLRVSLESLPEEEKYEIPDFEFEEDETDILPQEIPSLEETAEESAGLLAPAEEFRVVPRRRGLFMIFAALLALALALVFAFFIYRCSTGGRSRPQFVAEEQPSVASTPEPVPVPAPVLEQAPPTPPPPPEKVPASAAKTPSPELPPVAAPPVKLPPSPPPTPAEPAKTAGIRYRIRWGDTLWDLAYANYHNPWLYPKIAAANKIKNPDLIISGTWIIIPPR